MITWRRRKIGINGVFYQDKWIEEPNIVKYEVLKFFCNRMSTLKDFGVRLDNISFQKVTNYENCMLMALLEELEIKEVVWECKSDKRPGSDGVSFSFIKKN